MWTLSKKLELVGRSAAPKSTAGHAEETQSPIGGGLIHRRLADELGDHIGAVVDGADGRVHHVTLYGSGVAEDSQIGAIIEVGPASSQRPASRTSLAWY